MPYNALHTLDTSGHLSVATHTSCAEMLETDQVGPNLPFRVLSPVASQSPPAQLSEMRYDRYEPMHLQDICGNIYIYIYSSSTTLCTHTDIYIYIHCQCA